MLKSTLLAAALGLMVIAPASAHVYKCDEDGMTKFKTDLDALTDKERQALVMKEYDMARTAMDAKDMVECQTRMDNGGKGMQG